MRIVTTPHPPTFSLWCCLSSTHPPTHQGCTRTTNTNWRRLHANDLSILRTEAWVQRVWRVWWVAWVPLATEKRRGGERDGDMCDDSGFFFSSTFCGLIPNLSVPGGGFPHPLQSLGAFRGLLWDRTLASRTSYRHCARYRRCRTPAGFPMSAKKGHANGPLGSGQRTGAVLFHLRWSCTHGSSTACAGAADSASTCSMYNSTGASAATAAGAAPRTACIEKYTPSPALTLRTLMEQAPWARLAL